MTASMIFRLCCLAIVTAVTAWALSTPDVSVSTFLVGASAGWMALLLLTHRTG